MKAEVRSELQIGGAITNAPTGEVFPTAAVVIEADIDDHITGALEELTKRHRPVKAAPPQRVRFGLKQEGVKIAFWSELGFDGRAWHGRITAGDAILMDESQNGSYVAGLYGNPHLCSEIEELNSGALLVSRDARALRAW